MQVKRARRPASNLLLWSFIFSIVFHFTAGPLLAWLFGARLGASQQQTPIETISLTSSAVRLERRPQPRAATQIQPPAPQPHPQLREQPRARPRQAPPPRRELARINPRAEINVPRASRRHATQSSTWSTQLAQQQEQFNRTIAQLRRQNDPLISAARPEATPGTRKRYVYDFSGNIGTPLTGQGILVPLKSWQDGPYDYYYVRYWVLYPDGTNETGIVPWPVHFPAGADPIKQHWTRMPLPGPMADYVLPAGTGLHPLVAFCYEHRFSYCPIAHD